MVKKILLSLLTFVVVGACVVGVGFALEPESGFHALDENAACPVVGCASESCHGFDNVPEPNGEYEMNCPEVSCSSTSCHAWDTLIGKYKQASDASMNIWILAPVLLVVGLVVLITVLSKPRKTSISDNKQSNEEVGE